MIDQEKGPLSDSDGYDGSSEFSTTESDEDGTMIISQEVKVEESPCFRRIPEREDDWGFNVCFT